MSASPFLDAVRERIHGRVDAYLDEFSAQLMEHLQQGRAVRFSIAATIDDKAIEYSSSLGVRGIKAPRTCDKLDDPNQSTLGV